VLDGENDALEAIKALQYEGTRAESAQNFKEQGNEMVKVKLWGDAKEFYAKGIAVLTDKSESKWEVGGDVGVEAKKEKRGQGYDVTLTVKNTGTGRMPVEIAATSGARWAKAFQDSSYREAREAVVLGAGESKALTIHCAFSPDKVVVDPDVRVLQLNRKQATRSL